jgi:hypothetical protein
MAIGKISGTMLQTNLERQGVDLAIEGNIFYADVTNRRIGVGTANPTQSLDAPGNVRLANLTIAGNAITSNTGKLGLGSITGLIITGGLPYYIPYTDGYGNLNWGNLNTLSVNENFYANSIQLGANAAGAFTSSAASFFSTSNVTDSIAQLNYVLGKLVPPSPPTFPGSYTLAINSLTTPGRICNFTQVDNTATGSKTIAAGTSPTNVLRAAAFGTNTIANVGPGNQGTVTAYVNGANVGGVLLTGSSNGTYGGNLQITNNQDYNKVLSNVAVGFWSSFSATVAGVGRPGWNEVYINDTAGTSTNIPSWYYDSSTPGTPTWANTSLNLLTNTVIYSSTIPHLTTGSVFRLKGNVSKLSGDFYYSSDTFVTGGSGGPVATPTSVTYSQAGVTTPLAQNLYVSSGSAYLETNAAITASGFSSSSAGPTLTAFNSYSSASATFTPASTILYKIGTSNSLEELSIAIGSVGSGSGNGTRIINPDLGTSANNTPAFGSAPHTAFNSQSGTFYASDATVVAGSLKYDVTNYSTYLPAGPNLTTQNANQYFTFKFVRSAVTKFNISYTGSCAGVWIALPGSTIDTASSLNGWLDATTAYGGSGIPGVNSPGNGSNGCNLGGFGLTGGSFTVTTGSVSSSSTATNEFLVRIKLTSGQTISALSIAAATN